MFTLNNNNKNESILFPWLGEIDLNMCIYSHDKLMMIHILALVVEF